MKTKQEFDGIPEAPVIEEPEDHIAASKLQISDNEQIRIYIIWTVGRYPNGIRSLDIRAITTSLGKAQLYSQMLRRDKEFNRENWERVIIEKRVANHLYGQLPREMMVNTGRM